MAIPSLFRLSFFITLALACVTLTVANLFFLPLLPIFLGGVLVLIAYAWHSGERWQLSEQAANHLGIVIALGTLGWILFQLPRSEDDFVAGGVSYPAGLLPHLGPLLMLLLCVKIFRPMYLPDFWSLQTIGLMMVTLGCVLANDPPFGIALFLYLCSLIWCLTLFYHHRETLFVRGPLTREPLFQAVVGHETAEARVAYAWNWLEAAVIARRFAAVFFLGMVLFFLAPRFSNLQWEPKALSIGKLPTKVFRTGIDEGLDLNRVGRVELSDSPAFFFKAFDPQGNPTRFPADPRWVLQTLDLFERGRWRGISDAIETPLAVPNVRSRMIVPEKPFEGDFLGVEFKLQVRDAGGLPLLDPPDPRYAGFDAKVGDSRPQLGMLFFHYENADTVTQIQAKFRGTYRYQQFANLASISTTSRVANADEGYLRYILDQSTPIHLPAYAVELAERICDPAPPAPNEANRVQYSPEHHEKIARKLCAYLALSGDFEYSLELFRQDMSIDPVTDFLKNVKKGHCERFAGSLALLLRSLGIPSRIAKGYRGADIDDSAEWSVVRQSQAHSWVEVLLTHERPWRWLVLDPTPSNESALPAQKSLWEWLRDRTPTPASFWRDHVMRMNSDSQLNVVEFFAGVTRARLDILGIGGGVLGLALLAWWGRGWLRGSTRASSKSAPAPSPLPSFYERWLVWLRSHANVEPSSAETPLEFARRVQTLWAQNPDTAPWMDRPIRMAVAYNAHRFGGSSVPEEFLAEVDGWLVAPP